MRSTSPHMTISHITSVPFQKLLCGNRPYECFIKQSWQVYKPSKFPESKSWMTDSTHIQNPRFHLILLSCNISPKTLGWQTELSD